MSAKSCLIFSTFLLLFICLFNFFSVLSIFIYFSFFFHISLFQFLTRKLFPLESAYSRLKSKKKKKLGINKVVDLDAKNIACFTQFWVKQAIFLASFWHLVQNLLSLVLASKSNGKSFKSSDN